MKTMYLNNGLLAHEDQEAPALAGGAAALCQNLIDKGLVGIKHPEGHAEVELQIEVSTGFFCINKDGQLLCEFLVVPRGQSGQREWHSFLRRFETQARQGLVPGQPAGLQHPGSGPWTAVIIYPAMFNLPDAEFACLELARTAIARAFAAKTLPPNIDLETSQN